MRVLELMKQGWTQIRVAKELGLSVSAVSAAFRRSMDRLVKPHAEDVWKLELERLDDIHAALWSAVKHPQRSAYLGPEPDPEDYDDGADYEKEHGRWETKRLQAVKVLLDVHDRRLKMYGLHAANKHEISGPGGRSLEGGVTNAIVLPEGRLSDDDLDRLIETLESGNSKTIDVEARVKNTDGKD